MLFASLDGDILQRVWRDQGWRMRSGIKAGLSTAIEACIGQGATTDRTRRHALPYAISPVVSQELPALRPNFVGESGGFLPADSFAHWREPPDSLITTSADYRQT